MEEQVWAIAKWEDVYEKADCRRLKTLSWISLPTGFSSNGYSLMLEEFGDDAAAIYGAWCALIKVAAQCNRRGVLATTSGKPIRLSHIARLTGFPQVFFERLFKWASGDDVKWLVPMTYDAPGNSPGVPGKSAGVLGNSPGVPGDCSPPHYPTQPNPTGQNITPPNPTQPGEQAGGGGGGGVLVWDADGARRGAERLRKRFGRAELATEVCIQVSMAASALEPQFISTLISDCHGKQIANPTRYVLKAASNMVQRHGWDWDELVSQIPIGKKQEAVV